MPAFSPRQLQMSCICKGPHSSGLLPKCRSCKKLSHAGCYSLNFYEVQQIEHGIRPFECKSCAVDTSTHPGSSTPPGSRPRTPVSPKKSACPVPPLPRRRPLFNPGSDRKRKTKDRSVRGISDERQRPSATPPPLFLNDD